MKTIEDTIEFLYKQGQKEMAAAVINELKKPAHVTYTPPQPIKLTPIGTGSPPWSITAGNVVVPVTGGGYWGFPLSAALRKDA